MTDLNKNKNEVVEVEAEPSMEQLEKVAQMDQMKAQANLLGVQFAANIGFETLAERVRAFKVTNAMEKDTTEQAAPADDGILDTTPGLKVPADIEAQYAIFRAKQLVRVSITCVNPAKSELTADLYTIFSSSIGRVSQVIPYQAPNGHHIPRCLADFLREKKYIAFRPSNVRPGENGVDREHYEVPEFIITDLPPLTAEEYHRITVRQDRALAVRNDEDI